MHPLRDLTLPKTAKSHRVVGAPEQRFNGPLHALFVVSSLGLGGSEKKIVRLSNALHDQGYAVGIVSLGGPDTLRAQIHPDIACWQLHRKARLSLPAVSQLLAILKRTEVPVAFAVDLYSLLYIFLARLLLRSGGVRIVALLNMTLFVRRRDKVFMSLYAPMLRSVDSIVFGCERLKRDWVAAYRLPASRSQVIYNGVDAKAFARNAVGGSDSSALLPGGIGDRVVIGSVGRLAPEKNYVALVAALATLRDQGIDAQLVLVGDGPMRGAIESRALQLDLQARVTVLGQLSDVRPALATMDIFVLPSAGETFSNAALEAMAMELPVVITDTGGAAEMVRDGVDGFIVAGFDAESLANVIGKLCRDPVARRAMAAAAHQHVKDVFSFEQMVQQYANIIDGPTRFPPGPS